jgi:hypothetical protein
MTSLPVWIANGFLVILFFLVDHLASLGLLVSCGFFVVTTPPEQRSWSIGASALALAASMFAPSPVPFLMLLLSLAGWAVLHLEQYSRSARRWDIIRGLGLYGLAGIGYAVYRLTGLAEQMSADPMMTQGAVYLRAIIGIVMYVFPLGLLVFWAQSIFAHPPGLGKPEDVISKVRTRWRQ